MIEEEPGGPREAFAIRVAVSVDDRSRATRAPRVAARSARCPSSAARSCSSTARSPSRCCCSAPAGCARRRPTRRGAGASSGIEPRAGGSFEVDRGGGGLVVHVAGAVQRSRRLPARRRLAGDRRGRAGRRHRPAAATPTRSTSRRSSPTASRWSCRPGSERAGGRGAGRGSAATDGPISLGTATVEQLDTIEGIGPVTAADIIEFRDEHGGLSSVDELDQISGIGPATMEALRDRPPALDAESPTAHRLRAPRLVAWRPLPRRASRPALAACAGARAPPPGRSPAARGRRLAAPGARDRGAADRDGARWRAGVAAASLALAARSPGRRARAGDRARSRRSTPAPSRSTPGSGSPSAASSPPSRGAPTGRCGVRVDTPAGRLLVEAPEPVPELEVGGGGPGDRDGPRAPRSSRRAYLRRARDRAGARRSHRSSSTGPRARRARRPARRGPRARRGRARRRDAGGVGGPAARLRPRPGRPHRPGDRRRLQALRARPPARGVAARTSSCSRSSPPRCSPCSASRCGPGWSWILALIAVYVLRHRRRAVDPARRGDGRGRRSSPRSPAGRARAGTRSLLAAARRSRSTRARPPTSAGSSASPRSSGILVFAAPLARLLSRAGRPARSARALAEAAALTVAATLATAPLIGVPLRDRLAGLAAGEPARRSRPRRR